MLHHFFKISGNDTHGCKCHVINERKCLRTFIPFKGMGECVEPGRGGYSGRHCYCNPGINQCISGADLCGNNGCFHFKWTICQHRNLCNLGACTGCSGHRDKGKRVVLYCFCGISVLNRIITGFTLICCQQSNQLGSIYGAAAADSNNSSASLRPGKFGKPVNIIRNRIWTDVVMKNNIKPLFHKFIADNSSRLQTPKCDYHHTAGMLLHDWLKLRDYPGSESDFCGDSIVKPSVIWHNTAPDMFIDKTW